MNKKIGIYITQKVSGESYKACVPVKLPPEPPIELTMLYPYLEKATLALAELNSIHKTIPNTALFIYMYVRKEALLSSQIEGTQSSFSDLIELLRKLYFSQRYKILRENLSNPASNELRV